MKRTRPHHEPSLFRAIEEARTLAQERADVDEEPFVVVLENGKPFPIAKRKLAAFLAKHPAADHVDGSDLEPAPRIGAAA